jgi:hypothetical protein
VGDEYLWDRSGAPDPEIERLEGLLRPLGYGGGARRASGRRAAPSSRPFRAAGALALAAAVVLAAILGLLWNLQDDRSGRQGWVVDRVVGTPRVGGQPIRDRGELREGSALETDRDGRARVTVGEIGLVDVEPGSRIARLQADPDRYRLRLERGTLQVRIVAPPGRFIVETPSSTAVDLGCAYTLQVDEGGVGHVQVTSGWVGFEWGGRESLIPAGAMCLTRPRFGPGTPYYTDVTAGFRAALETLDFGGGDSSGRRVALDRILEESRATDALTLWHLLSRVGAGERERVFDRLAGLIRPPAQVTREGIVQGDPAMLDRWRTELGLGDASIWRAWKEHQSR